MRFLPARLAVLFAVPFISIPLALGMSVRETRKSLARSADGSWELVEIDSSGPEGGGSLAYRVDQGGKPGSQFVVSSTFSPGDGSEPQGVAEKDCRQAVTKLGELLKQRGFSGVAVHPEACGKTDRGGAVTVDGR